MKKRIGIILCCGWLTWSSYGQSFFDALYSDTDAKQEIHLVLDIAHLLDHVEEEEYQQATLKWVHAAGDTTIMQTEIKTRGNSRKKICSFPPVKIKIDKEELEAHQFVSDFNDHKLVLQCRDVRGYDQFLYREYLVYKLYSMLSPVSFRVQLVDIWFIDPDHPKYRTLRPGFIIEDEKQLAARHAGNIREEKVTSIARFDDHSFFRFCLFQFLIANTDWAMGNLHNLKYLHQPEDDVMYAVPYDFDYSGLVNAPYATPMEGLPIESVTARYYRGVNPDEPVFWSEVDLFREALPAMQELCGTFSYLEDKHRRSMERMLSSFERMLNKPRRLYRIVGVKEE